ncbi:MAG: Cof-type HAD-IIB family hydrolase [Clostridiales bacterium]|nr:Cof-type HAD-IIB family hydrolase [Clostridiales bacterium]
MKKKILILDIDGTLTNSKKVITEKTLEALLKVQERGIIIALASGRPTYGMKAVSDTLQLERFGGYILSFNGARIMNMKTKEIVYQQKFPLEYILPLYEYAVQHDMGLVTYEKDKVVTGTRFDEYMELEANINHMNLTMVEDFPKYVNFDINKCLFTAKTDVAPELEQELVSRYGHVLSIYRSEPFFIEAMPPGVDKAASLSHLFEILGIDRMEAVACGDGFNDQSMIEYAGVGVAMANAQERVKVAADYVTKHSNDEDGLVEVISKFFDLAC